MQRRADSTLNHAPCVFSGISSGLCMERRLRMGRLVTAAVLAAAGAGGLIPLPLALGPQATASGAEAGRGAKPLRRAVPPAAAWDRATMGIFSDNAFATLEGPRPDFAVKKPAAAAAAGEAVAGAVAAPQAGSFKWSSLVSEETLTDEVKELKPLLSAVVASQSDFKGGGYDKAREGFSSLALAFGVIAAYDQDIRWKKQAENARDLFARVGVNCKVGTDQSFAESKARVADLEALLEGNAIDAKADREEDFLWSQVAGRPPLMSRLEVSDGILGGGIASKGDFDKQVDKLLHELEIVAVIGETIQQKDFEYNDDDSYRGYASGMRDAALKARESLKKGDYDGTRAAVGDLKKSCDACHGDYRS